MPGTRTLSETIRLWRERVEELHELAVMGSGRPARIQLAQRLQDLGHEQLVTEMGAKASERVAAELRDA